jgi:hypothetical protein
MSSRLPSLRLIHAPREDAGASLQRLQSFLDAMKSPNIRSRSEVVIRSAIDDESIFFVETASGQLIAITGFYRHGEPSNEWGELGTTVVHQKYRGFQLQSVLYRYIISLEWLADWPPNSVIAIVDEKAISSWKNLERCRFVRSTTIPHSLMEAKPEQDWSKIRNGQKRLYLITNVGVAESLIFASQNPGLCILRDHDDRASFSLSVEFRFLRQPGVSDALRQEAQNLLIEPPDGEDKGMISTEPPQSERIP